MNADALAEWEWWENLDDDDREINTRGVPPYDVVLVSDMVQAGMLWLNTTDGPILDFGCGTGRLTCQLARRLPWHSFVGVDISGAMVTATHRRAEEMGITNVGAYICDGRNLPENLPEFSAAYSVTVFQHMPLNAQGEMIRQIADRLRPLSRFVFTIITGTEDAFLSHQVPDRAIVEQWCRNAGLQVLTIHHDTERDWCWVIAEKTP